MTVEIPPGIAWRVHRIATSERYGGLSPHEIRTRWSWLEVLEANEVLDAFADAEARANRV